MTALPIFDHHTGSHRVKRPERPKFFRSVLRLILRRPFALAAPLPARAETALIADRWPCCIHCVTEDVSACDPPNMHLTLCSDGCNDPAPVLGEQMLSEVREQWNEWHDGDQAAARHALTEPAGFPALSPAAAASVLAANRNAEALGFGFRISLTPQEHADIMHAGYANAVDRLRKEAGLPTVEQMHAMRAGSPEWLFPPLEPPVWAEPVPRGPVHDTRLDVFAPHYVPGAGAPVYGEVPVADMLAAERLAKGLIA